MGHKVHPIGFRLGIIRDWSAKWYAEKQYAGNLYEDMVVRRTIQSKAPEAGISLVDIDRQGNDILVTIHSARPGIIIGRGGSGIEDIKRACKQYLLRKIRLPLKTDLRLSVEEVKGAESKAAVVAQGMVEQIEKRIPYRRVLRQTLERILQNKEVQGAKVMVGGRLDGNEIARREKLYKGKIPLHTLRANIDYAQATAFTTFGTVGIKVWIYK